MAAAASNFRSTPELKVRHAKLRCRRTHAHTHTDAHLLRDTQFIMAVMRCERRSLMIVICVVTLQRLKIGKGVAATATSADSSDRRQHGAQLLVGCVCVTAHRLRRTQSTC